MRTEGVAGFATEGVAGFATQMHTSNFHSLLLSTYYLGNCFCNFKIFKNHEGDLSPKSP